MSAQNSPQDNRLPAVKTVGLGVLTGVVLNVLIEQLGFTGLLPVGTIMFFGIIVVAALIVVIEAFFARSHIGNALLNFLGRVGGFLITTMVGFALTRMLTGGV